ncbi:MAG: GntR family transcriptional regulator [Deltaproteobacteria bacterium]|jgi:DNA-binding GntR family transcriptional regulator|nr:GntR family transcriptional regulator [Deltaproteobacteria bacterium]
MDYKVLSRPEKIFKTIRDRIVYMEYPPGKLLPEKDLCDEFKVSRTPIREAIQKLKEMKLVTVIPRYGTYVSPVDINEIRSAFEVKIKLEGLAGEVAAKRITADKLAEMKALIEKADALLKVDGHRHLIEIDAQFHEIIYQATQNPILLEMLENLHSRCARLWNSALSEVIPIATIITQLKEIYSCLERRDSQKARQLMEDHVRYFIDQIKNQLL